MRLLAIAIGVLMACGDDAPRAVDGGDDTGTPDAGSFMLDPPIAPAAPTPPALPELGRWSCPTGWRAIDRDDGSAYCSPWPESGAPECGPDELATPGGTCSSLCAGLAPIAGTILRVPSEPYPDLAAAVRAFSAGATIELAAGRYTLPSTALPALTIRGACPGLATIALTAPLEVAADLTLEGLAIEGASHAVHTSNGTMTMRGVRATGAAIVATDGARLVVERVRIEDTAPIGIHLVGASATLRDVSIADIEDDSAERALGNGIRAEDAQLDLERVAVEHTTIVGVRVSGTSMLTARDLYVAHVAPDPEAGGQGIVALDGARLDLTRVVVEDVSVVAVGLFGGVHRLTDVEIAHIDRAVSASPGFAVYARQSASLIARRVVAEDGVGTAFYAQEASHLDLEDVVVRDFAPTLDDAFNGGAIVIGVESQAELRRIDLERCAMAGLSIQGENVDVEAEDVTIRDTLSPQLEDIDARAINVFAGAHVTLRRIEIEGYREVGLAFFEASGSVEDLRVHDTETDLTVPGGFGLGIAHSVADVHRARIERARSDAVVVFGETTHGTIEDLDVDLVRARERSGRGVDVFQHATLTMRRARIDRAHDVGLFVVDGSRVEGGDLAIAEMADPGDDVGSCVQLQDASFVALDRVRLTRCVAAGAAVYDASDLALHDLVIEDTRGACGSACERPTYGDGVLTHSGGRVELERFEVTRSARCGVSIGTGELSMRDGRVTANTVGVCAFEPPDLDAIAEHVVFENAVQLEAGRLPVPEASPPPSVTLDDSDTQ